MSFIFDEIMHSLERKPTQANSRQKDSGSNPGPAMYLTVTVCVYILVWLFACLQWISDCHMWAWLSCHQPVWSCCGRNFQISFYFQVLSWFPVLQPSSFRHFSSNAVLPGFLWTISPHFSWCEYRLCFCKKDSHSGRISVQHIKRLLNCLPACSAPQFPPYPPQSSLIIALLQIISRFLLFL